MSTSYVRLPGGRTSIVIIVVVDDDDVVVVVVVIQDTPVRIQPAVAPWRRLSPPT